MATRVTGKGVFLSLYFFQMMEMALGLEAKDNLHFHVEVNFRYLHLIPCPLESGVKLWVQQLCYK